MPRASATFVALAACFSLATPAHAALANQASVEELARTSDAVIRGRVERQASRVVGKRIVTDVDIQVSAVWRGTAPRRIQVTVPGGVVGDLGQRVDGVASFSEGEDVVVFAGRSKGGKWRVSGGAQGKFRVEAKEARPDLSEVKFLRSDVKSGERGVEAMPLAELERRVKGAR